MGDSVTTIKKRTDFANAVATIVGAIFTLAGAIGTVMDGLANGFTKLIGSPIGWGWQQHLFVSGVIVILFAVTIRLFRSTGSILAQPDKLWRDPKTPDQLIGRDDDRRLLRDQLVNRLVFLVSESGCGKSAVLRAGIAMDEETRQRYLPILLDLSAHDWADTPLSALRDEFTRALPEGHPCRGQLSQNSSADDYARVFKTYYDQSGRRVLLLLDQFDDYQAQPRHRDRFCPPSTRVWRSASSIKAENAFWRALDAGLDCDALHVIVAVRAEASPGLDCIALTSEPPKYELSRLPSDLAQRMIADLSDRIVDGKPIILFPERGWTALRDRLARNLHERGAILPQQLKVAMGGLRTLKTLSPGTYSRIGGLGALEAGFVDRAIANAAASSGLKQQDVLDLLLRLVDSTRVPPDKTPPKQVEALLAEGTSADAVRRALEMLARDDIVRRSGDAAAQSSGWQLDHAYLAQPIRHLDRDRNKWNLLLAERAQAHEDAGWRQFWRTLLPVREQIAMALAWGKPADPFRYFGHRRYAALSLLRLAPTIALIGMLGGGVWTFREWEHARFLETQLASLSDKHFFSFELGDESQGKSATEGLTSLQGASWLVRWRVATDVMTGPEYAAWFTRQPAFVLRAIAGLDQSYRRNLLTAHLTTDGLLQTDGALRSAIDALVTNLLNADLPSDTHATLWNNVVASLSSPERPHLRAIGAALESLAPARPNDDPAAAEVLRLLREAIGKAKGAFELDALAYGYTAVAGRLKADGPAVAEEIRLLRVAMGKTTDAYQLNALARGYAAVADRLKDSDPSAAEVLRLMREAMGKTTDAYQLNALTSGYAAVVGRLKGSDPSAAEVLRLMREAMGKTADTFILKNLASGYAAVAGRLKDDDPAAAEVLRPLREAMGKTTNRYDLGNLASGYAAVASRLKDSDPAAAEMLRLLREPMEKVRSVFELSLLASGYADVVGLLKSNDPTAAAEIRLLREAMEKGTDAYQLGVLAVGYAAMTGRLQGDDPAAAEVLELLREAMGKTTEAYQLNALGRGYAAVAGQLQSDDPAAAEEFRLLREAMGKTTEAYQFNALARGYAAVARRTRVHETPFADIRLMREQLLHLRAAEQFQAVAEAMLAAARLGQTPLSWQQTGALVTSLLHHPFSAGKPTAVILDLYEAYLTTLGSGAPKVDPPWKGNVWAFAAWAEKDGTLPGFHVRRVNPRAIGLD